LQKIFGALHQPAIRQVALHTLSGTSTEPIVVPDHRAKAVEKAPAGLAAADHASVAATFALLETRRFWFPWGRARKTDAVRR